MYKDAIGSAPDIVVIMLGTNDAQGCNWGTVAVDRGGRSNFWDDYTSLVQVF
eukprot:SAG31_NODE_27294_length_428_cov_0.948328_1_plen_51_part_10